MTFRMIAGAAAMAAAACVTAGNAEDSRDDPRLGAEVDSICFAQNINGWRAVKGENDVVLLQRGVNDWYRVELAGGCHASLFRSAIGIGLDTRPGGGCIHRGDAILVEEPGLPTPRRCMIRDMYEWDLEAGDDDKGDDDKGDGGEADDTNEG